jgi:hypothetical protein
MQSTRNIFSPVSLRRFIRRFLEVFGVSWLLIEPLALWKPEELRFGIAGYFGLATFSLLIASVLSLRTKTISGRLPVSDTTITVTTGNLLEQSGNIIIGVADTFDTEIGDVIAARSLQGQFQAKYFPHAPDLDLFLEKELANKKSKDDKSKTRGKTLRFPIGTTTVIRKDDSQFFLVAYTKMRSDLRAESDICMLASALRDCWEAIRTRGANAPVHMAVVGSGLARIGLSRSLLIQFIVLSFLDAQKAGSLTGHLTIYVLESDLDHVSFADMSDWLSGITRLA